MNLFSSKKEYTRNNKESKQGAFTFLLLAVMLMFTSCGIYSFNERSQIEPDAKTVRVQMFVNRAQYQNPQLTPQLTEKLRSKVINQTRLTQTNSDNADYDIEGTITEYSVSTTGVTNSNGRQQSSLNRLTVGARVKVFNQIANKTEEFNVSRSFDFSASQSLQSAEAGLLDEIIRNLTDEIFNQIFSKW